ncbi:MAG: glycosyltransferase [Hyphomonadaceae bacterium]|nr:glycosyltransferase [Hyphomonadaceae bacterium]
MSFLVICIPTYQRNEELTELLAALQEQAIPAGVEMRVRILVIDNNPDGRAKSVTDALQKEELAYPVHYVRESEPGVAHVRNRALTEASQAGDDFLVFIDDDELPAEHWLATLWQRQVATGAAVVFGTVEALYESAPPDWMKAGDFHSKPVLTDGLRAKPGATDNCLIDLAVVRGHGLSFDTSLSLVGGEDTLFFDALLRQDEIFADAAGAKTFERIPDGRATLDWLLTRWRRTGMTDALMIHGRRGGGVLARVLAGGEGVLRILIGGGLAALVWTVKGGRMSAACARRLYTFQRGRGMVDFALGRLVLEYDRPVATPESQPQA